MKNDNPLLQEWNGPFSSPPLDQVKPEHFIPALITAIEEANKEINLITVDSRPPDFDNSIAALDNAGKRLDRLVSLLFNLNGAETSAALQEAARDASPLLTKFSNDITLNTKLFQRIQTVYNNRMESSLTTEQKILTEKKYRNFILGGAGLNDDDKNKFRNISEELSILSLKFDENILEETNSYTLHLTDEPSLAGLPGGLRDAASAKAVETGKEGWIFTLHFPSYVPFMQYSERRDLREKMFRAYTSRAFRANEHDNRELVTKIVNRRIDLARLLGFENVAAMILGDRMADTPQKVTDFLEKLYTASLDAARNDMEAVARFAAENGFSEQLQRWDWAYYAEKLKMKLYDFDDETLRPYFKLENAEKAIFNLAETLYGISFIELDNIPVYHEEVKTFEVKDADGSFLALLYIDYHPRPGKSGGAWMTSYREQYQVNGNDVRPLVSIVTNFTRPGASRPSLLSFSELTTLLHEFGHALHGILSKCTYEGISGTSVARDFVELPSQFMENYAYRKEWLDKWAFHFETGERIPVGLLDKIIESSTYNEGYACLRQLSFGFLDMSWHMLTEPFDGDISSFENQATGRTELFPIVEGSNISTSFSHIFSGGYAAGYYGYKWAEVLDADAFDVFIKNGIFNSETALKFRKNILEKGGSENPMSLYKQFRGGEPSIDPFLRRSGLIKDQLTKKTD